MSEDISLALPPDGLAPLHDVLAELDYPNNPEGGYSQEVLLETWKSLDREHRLEAHKWGLGDTVVRDEIYVFLKEQRAP